ncbi:hypothetical protein KKA03_06370 [archaeon]|nr:hypothetical protein [archaeon]
MAASKVKAIREIVFPIVLAVLILSCPPVFAGDFDTVRQAGLQYAMAGEGVMVDGPFYVSEKPYWIVDFIKKGEAQASLVYDIGGGRFVTRRDTMKRVFGTRAFKNATESDPLFYAAGDPSVIPLAAKYDTQNVRNFAQYSPLDPDELDALEIFLSDYETMAEKIADSILVTNELLRPGVDIRVSYEEYPLKILIDKRDTTDQFSYEGCLALLDSYEGVYSVYSKMTDDLKNFTGPMDDLPPGHIIRQKLHIKITKESILGEIDLAVVNGQEIRGQIDARWVLLEGDYEGEIKTAESRLQREESINTKIGIIIAALLIVVLLRLLRKRPGSALPIFLILMIFPVYAAPLANPGIPTPDELLAGQVRDTTQVELKFFTDEVNDTVAKGIIAGYPHILEGESVYVGGPYYDEGEAYYLFDIVDDGVPTGNIILVDAPTLHKVGSYRIIDRLVKTSFLTSMVQERPLYQSIDEKLLEEEALKAADSSIAVFLARLAENIREGKELEQALLLKPEFETARDLGRNYKKGFTLLEKLQQVASAEEVETLTHGFSNEEALLEGYYLAVRYPITDDFLQISQSRYRGRCLNRIPMMKELSDAGLSPGKPQVAHDLATDLIYGNSLIWRLGKIEQPYFASLPRQVGEISSPGGN